MSRRILYVLVALACFAWPAGSAQAENGSASRIVFTIQNFGDGSAACGDALFGLSFDMVSPRGALLGTGRACVHAIDGCDPFGAWVPGCHRTLQDTFVLDFAQGSVIAQVRLREVFPTPTTFIQLGVGPIAAGTGSFAGARGYVVGGGSGSFTEGVINLVYAVDFGGRE
jgi:hypothetical protein